MNETKNNCFSSIVNATGSSSNNSNMNYSQVIKSKLQQAFFLSRPSAKKIVFGLLFIFVLLYYVVPLMWSGGHRYIVLSRIERCLEDKLRPYASKEVSKNTFIYHTPQIKDKPEKYFLPYVGNGYIGISLDGNHGVWLKGVRGLDIATDYNPIVHFEIKGYDIREAMVLDIVDGRIVKHSCFQEHNSALSNCISLVQTWYIHRTRPGLLVQEVSFYNPTDDNIEVSVSQGSLSSWANEYKSIDNLKDTSQSDADTATTWQVGSKTLANEVLLTVASRQFSQTGILELPAKRSVSRHSLTVFDYTLMSGSSKDVTQQTIRERRTHTVNAVKSVLGTGDDHLLEQHKAAWHELWNSGFAISDSKALHSLNSDVINSTLYYILSHVSSPLQEVTSSIGEKQTAANYLNNPEGCYHNKHHTLQFSSLWEIGDKVQTMNKGVDTHLSSLDHYGCSTYIKAGAAGILQAVLLSLGGFSFKTTNNKVLHMEFNADPADLHRDYQFTNIRYANLTLLNISVIVDASNFAVLHVSSSAENFYASDAGLTELIPLSKEVVTLPVKLTKPLTAILYISNNRQHLIDMKRVVHHIEEPVIAPAQDHRVLARHKHGHSYGGLPVIFWIMLALLIIVFHFFLFKMVFSELCKSDSGSYYRRRALS